MSTKNTRHSFVTMALQAALEDLSETVKPKSEQVAETTDQDVTALSNGEGPQAELDNKEGKTIPALENDLPVEQVAPVLGEQGTTGVDGGALVQEDLEQAVDAVAALESISEALNHTVRTGTATLASNTGFSMAMEQVMRSLKIDASSMNYGLESADAADIVNNPSIAAKKMADFASGAASRVTSAVTKTIQNAVKFHQLHHARVAGSARDGA